MEIKQIQYNSDEYRKALDLRNRILRQPLNLSFFTPESQEEQNDIHIACIENDFVIATVLLTLVDKNTFQMKQLAVEENQQGRGIGSSLLQYAEKIAREHKISHIVLSARTSVLDFYRKMGYKTIGQQYISESTHIPHFKMEKDMVLPENI